MNRNSRINWINRLLLPLLNVLTAFIATAFVFVFIDVDPIEATEILLYGAFGYQEGIGYTLYYATNFIFTGLAVAVAFHAGLFNIGGEGQAYIGGLGTSLVILMIDPNTSPLIFISGSILGSLIFGGLWALIPAYLQAYRGSHIVITTIMFNFLASSLMVYLLVNVLRQTGQMTPESQLFPQNSWLPFIHNIAENIGFTIEESPLNISIFVALFFSILVWIFIWHTRWGYAIRATGLNSTAALYAGIKPKRIIILSMCISGALAGLVGINELAGYQHRLIMDFHFGYGFGGIAVALMGRNHPIGIIIAAILFGILYQGGAELAFEMENISRDIIVVMQALIILFCGALQYMYRPWLIRILAPIEKAS
jgi:simple sugar transport system permease protein